MIASLQSADVFAPGHAALVLDDDATFGVFMCRALQSTGLSARHFTHAAAFFAALELTAPKLIVLDLSLGESDGIEVIYRLECMKFAGSVLLVSGHSLQMLQEVGEIARRRGLRVLSPLKKPVRRSDLALRVAEISALDGQERTPVVAVDACVDLASDVSVDIEEALRKDWLEVWYQPKIALKSLSVVGAEALLRARHPQHGVVLPRDLLPRAGDALFRPISEFVIGRALSDWASFVAQDMALKLAVNVPASVVQDRGFIDLLRSVLPRDRRFPGLIVEITENELISEPERMREVAIQLKLYNVSMSIDDFGSAYSSFSRLSDVPFDEIKLDRSYVSNCATNHLKHALCQTLVELGQRLGASVCAEGVERPEELRSLIEMGCDTAQGFLFAEAMPADLFVPSVRKIEGSIAALA
jgi:EAL domain-containing protein (putative c-di-GMP-specific phosphodiesterase class I)/FixJ family two-component response regulator